jgi:hypothetical protein
MTNHERVGKALELLKSGLGPFVGREVKSAIAANSLTPERVRGFIEDPLLANKPVEEWDVSALLKLMWETWNEVFGRTLGRAERSLVQELRDWRNKWAHQEPFSSRDAERAMDSMVRLLTAVSAKEADEVDRMMMELRRLTIEEQVRGEKRKAGGSLIEAASGTLKPWREIVTPHADVASGRYQQAEFAADLWQVHLGEGSDEYREPAEFFRRTFLTESLKRLLVGAVERLSGKGGDPVVQLQTNFGGGKTHSMLALYHLFGGSAPGELAGVDEVMAAAGVTRLPTARRVVLVGNKISPGNPVTKPDGTVVRTLWGELAWQLGGPKAYARIAKDDENATSPGDALRELLREHGPCLILIDEWVAYARQLHDQSDLPAGSFETQFTFAQALTESAKLAGNCLLVISLPARTRQARRTPRRTTWRWAACVAVRRSTACATWSGAWSRRGGRRRPRKASRSCGGACSSRSPAQKPSSSATSRRAPLPTSTARKPRISARVQERRLRKTHPGRVSDPPGDLRPALRGLVHAGQVPAHARRAAPDGGRDSLPVGEGRPQPADPAVDDSSR